MTRFFSKKYTPGVLIVTFVVFFLVLLDPTPASAQSFRGFLNCDGVDCSLCNFVETVNRVISWLIGILMMLFAVLMMKAGFELVASRGNTAALTAAKDSFTNAIIGLVIILSAWIIVDTIMRGLNVQDIMRGGPLPWSQMQCQAQSVPEVDPRETPASEAVAPQFAGRATDPVAEAQARESLRAAGVTVQTGVRLDGVSAARLQEITRLASECQAAMGASCGLQVSSGLRLPGNPAGVGTHGLGAALDLSTRSSPVFNEWMTQRQSSYPRVASFGGHSGYQVSPSTVCTWEGPDGDSTRAHWHCAPPTR